MNASRPYLRSWALAVIAATCVSCRPGADGFDAGRATAVPRPPHLRPDYSDTVIPPNIAPLNFVIEEPGRAYHIRIRGPNGNPLELARRTPAVVIPERPWRALLTANSGGPLYLEVFVQREAGGWEAFAAITNQVARERIDSTLVYRLLKPLYNFYSELGIYQRDLESARQKPILENRDFGGGCLNCHTTLNRQPDPFTLHIRGVSSPQPMLLARSNDVVRVDKTAGYLSWHPSGRLLAFSANTLSTFFHTIGETRDVFDSESNLGVYWIDTNVAATPPPIAQPGRLETWPSWSPDGQYLYFCSAPKMRRERFRVARYDLMRVRFDLDHNTWGEPEMVVSAAETGLSAAQPRVSPDGRWLLFCLAKYGNFPIYQPSSDLYLMELNTRQFRRLEINSDVADTWHCWSSNGRWVVFSSKRGTGLLARPHFSYVDEQGRFSKPFILPQGDPTFYDACLETFNLPEFVQGPIRISPRALARAVLRPRMALKPTGDTQQGHNEEQYGQPAPRREAGAAPVPAKSD